MEKVIRFYFNYKTQLIKGSILIVIGAFLHIKGNEFRNVFFYIGIASYILGVTLLIRRR